ncbi:MAG: hypothetical protein ACLR1M_13485 [Oscillospiraceae bacterium]
MGLIKAIAGAAGGVMADQWKEYFYCEAMPANILATKGHKKVTGRSSNYKGDENIITNGSMIAVADGQCMLIVEQGKVVEVCAEPGEFLYDTSTEPSIFSGKLGDGIGDVFSQHRQALHLRRRSAQGSARLLLQHQGAHRQQVWHGVPPSHSASWISARRSTSTWASAASASTAIISPTRSCSTRTSAAT